MATPTTDRPATGALLEQQHLTDPLDGLFAALACEHPESCSCDDDYSDWAANLAARIDAERTGS